MDIISTISRIECRQHVNQIIESKSKLIQISHNVWSDKATQVSVEYSYCCHVYNSSQTRLIIKKFEAVYNFHSSKLMSANINLESCNHFEKMHCATEGAIVVWNEAIATNCGYVAGNMIVAEVSNNIIVSEQGQLAVVMTGKVETHCGQNLETTDQDMLILRHEIFKVVEHPTKNMLDKLRLDPPYIVEHTATHEGHLAFVAFELEKLTYAMFLKNYLAICRLRFQRYQSMKYLMQNGHAMYVTRMLLNSSSVTGYDAGPMLAIKMLTNQNFSIFHQSQNWTRLP
jgi:hypothetical protein